MEEALKIADREFESRLFTGTGKFASNQVMETALLASGSELVTVALKRVDINDKEDQMLHHLRHSQFNLLPNTSGVRTAKEAVFAAELAREALETNWLKLEIHPDPKYLMPDPVETLAAAETLVKLGFVVLPYIHADPVICKRLEEVGLCSGNAAGLSNWFQSRASDPQLFRNHYRPGQGSCGSRCRDWQAL